MTANINSEDSLAWSEPALAWLRQRLDNLEPCSLDGCPHVFCDWRRNINVIDECATILRFYRNPEANVVKASRSALIKISMFVSHLDPQLRQEYEPLVDLIPRLQEPEKPELPFCPGKKCFKSRLEADMVIARARIKRSRRKRKGEVRSYYCAKCEAWHVTSKDRNAFYYVRLDTVA